MGLEKGGVMSLQDFMPMIQTGGIGLLVILLGLIRIPKIDINLWSILARVIGKALNGEVIEKINNLTSDFEDHLRIEEEERMKLARQRILRFNDELLFRTKHSKEHYDDVLEDINQYEQYCHDHPDYKNDKAHLAIDNIRNEYNVHLHNHDFLGMQEIV